MITTVTFSLIGIFSNLFPYFPCQQYEIQLTYLPDIGQRNLFRL